MRALDGVKVLDLAWVVAGPTIGRSLADYGATVVRVESSVRIEAARMTGPYAGGKIDPQRSALYDVCNTGKFGIALDLGKEAGRDVVRDLTSWADVLIESFAPGQMARWGLSHDSLRAINPRLIGLSTSLLGQTGPFAAFAGFGNIGAAVAGFQSVVGREGALPIGPFGPYTDFVGPRFALVTLLAALDQCRRTGQGCWLDVAQAEAGIQFLAAEVAQCAATSQNPVAIGNRDPAYAPHGVFRCAGDDEWVAIVARDDEDWVKLAGIIGGEALNSEFRTLEGRKAQESKLEQIIETWTQTQTALDIQHTLQAIGVPAHQVSKSADLVSDPQLLARGHFVRLPHPLGGESVVDGSRYRLSETPAEYHRPAPHFGRDTHQILTEILGYDEKRIAALDAAGILR
jgi:crotonobetainyl-CoA:carnitine CoA-transferase CaiB-like acyl-CoA transferase